MLLLGTPLPSGPINCANNLRKLVWPRPASHHQMLLWKHKAWPLPTPPLASGNGLRCVLRAAPPGLACTNPTRARLSPRHFQWVARACPLRSVFAGTFGFAVFPSTLTFCAPLPLPIGVPQCPHSICHATPGLRFLARAPRRLQEHTSLRAMPARFATCLGAMRRLWHLHVFI